MPSGQYKRTEKHKQAFREAIKKRRYKYKGGYDAIHWWLNKYFGKANKCDNKKCNYNKTKRYEYALIKGKKYKYKRENFIMLCKSCHIKYDFTKEGKESIRKLHLGRKQSKEHIQKRIEKLIGLKMSDYNKKKMSERKKGVPCYKLRKKCIQYDLGNSFIREWDSLTEASKFYKIGVSSISSCCAGRLQTVGGYKWKLK